MRKPLLNIFIFILAAFGIGSLGAFADTVYNVVAGTYFVEGFTAICSFYGQSAVLNSVFVMASGVLMVLLLLVYVSIPRKYRLDTGQRWAFIYGPPGVFLVLLLVAVPVNVSLLPFGMEPESLVVNVVMFISGLILSVIAVMYGFIVVRIFERRNVQRLTYGLFVVSILFIVAGFSFFSPGSSFRSVDRIDGPNVIIITIDALRQDRVGAYGNGYIKTPNLDTFSEISVRFEEACTNSPWTVPSMFTMNSSYYPGVHRADRTHVGNENIVMLAEVLNSHGYDTEAYVANQVLYGELGFKRGFDRYAEYGDITSLLNFKRVTVYRFYKRFRDIVFPYLGIPGKDSTSWLTNEVVKTLNKNRRRPLYLWAHYLDPHAPLTPPRNYMYGEKGFVEEAIRFGFLNTANTNELKPDDQDKLIPLYEAEVRYVDDMFGDVIGALDQNGFFENSIIIVTADHGEEFFEHGRYGHSKTHYDEVISIPLIIYIPDSVPAVTDYPASLVDIMPTVLDYVGADAPPGMSGESLLPVIYGNRKADEDKFIFIDRTAFDHNLKSARFHPYTIIRTGSEKHSYDVRDNRIHEEPDDIVIEMDDDLYERYRSAVDEWAAFTDAEAEALGTTTEIEIDSERREKLKGLGYLN